MRDRLVIVGPQPNDNDMDMRLAVLPAMRTHAEGIPAPPEWDWEERAWSNKVQQWLVEEADVPALVAHVTSNFPGREVNVYTLSQVYFRTVGELETKVVTKDGVLPF